MDRPDLDDAFHKLRWAAHHFDLLKPDLERLEHEDSHTISLKLDAETGQYSFHVEGLQEPGSDLGLIVGDCVHNARTALDYLMVRLYALASAMEPRDVEGIQFPIYDDPKKFPGAVGPFNVYPAARGYITRIEELQPYNNGNPSIWGVDEKGWQVMHALPSVLDRLSKLDNIDKHRVTHAVWSQVNIIASIGAQSLTPPASSSWSRRAPVRHL